MKAVLTLFGGLAAVALVAFMVYQGTYNSLVRYREAAISAISEVQNACQRQADLIPNIATTVKKYDSHEADVFKGVAEARSTVAKLSSLPAEKLATDVEAQKQLQVAQQAVQRSISLVVEAYPQLKAAELHRGLMDELAGSQNRISVARTAQIRKTQAYNATLQGFLTSMFMAGKFEKLTYPEFKQGNDSSVKVEL